MMTPEALHLAARIGWSPEKLAERMAQFHAERLQAVPDKAQFPEIQPHVAELFARYKTMKESGMSEEMIAMQETFPFWQKFFCEKETGVFPWVGRYLTDATRERCRVIYAPRTDHGAVRMKNVDDPINTWKPIDLAGIRAPWRRAGWEAPVIVDGVGNGLHIDEAEPALFPLQVYQLVWDWKLGSVDETVEVYTRYYQYWDNANTIIHDRKGYAVSLDKPGRARPVLRKQNAQGVIFVNGMSSFDDDCEAYIRRMRALYLKKTGQTDDSPESVYFRLSENVRNNLLRRMEDFSRALTVENLMGHLTSFDADGPMCKRGLQHHPDDPIAEATLLQVVHYLDEHRATLRQWEGSPGHWTPVWERPWTEIRLD